MVASFKLAALSHAKVEPAGPLGEPPKLVEEPIQIA
jgi:hypothetical protein